MVRVFHRVGASSGAASLRDSLLLFLRTSLRLEGGSSEERKLLRKRAKLAAKVCDSLGALENQKAPAPDAEEDDEGWRTAGRDARGVDTW